MNEHALAAALAPRAVRLYEDADFAARPRLPKGYIGPHYDGATVVIADPSVREHRAWVTGANRIDHHARDAVLGRDFDVDVWADLVVVAPGDPCPRCEQPLRIDRGIEVGHVFQLGTKYTDALDARFTDETGVSHSMLMGCYGIGISRALAAIVEVHHDEHGLVWPRSVAPFDVHLIALKGDEVRRAADEIYESIVSAGVDVLYDDRDASPGVKFADADLIGVPVQLIVGAKGLQRGIVERKVRATGARDDVERAGISEIESFAG